MKILIVFISLILTINCQNSGFRFFFDGNRLLGNGNNLNGGLNSNLNGGFNNNLNGLNANSNDANLNLMNDADRMGSMSMILGGNQQLQPQQFQPQQLQPQQFQPQQLQPQQLQSQQSQQQSQFQQQSASFTDRLNYAPPNSPALQVPIPSSFNTPTVLDYKNEITSGPILAPGLLAPLPRIPDLPAAPAPNTFGLTNLGKQIAPQTFNPNGNLPPAPPQNNNNSNNSANLSSVPSLPQLNNNNLGNGLNNFNNGLNNGLNNGASLNGNQFQNDLALSANRELPIEISQFSTRIIHDSPAKSSPLLNNLGRLNGLRS